MTDSDRARNHEVAAVAFIVARQLNYFKFSDTDLIKIHRVSEIKLCEHDVKPTKQQLEDWPGTWNDQLEGAGAKLELKCEAPVRENKIGRHSAEKFAVSEVELRNKRTVQQKAVEFLFLQLFKTDMLIGLIDVLFLYMKRELQKFNDSQRRLEDIAKRLQTNCDGATGKKICDLARIK